MENAKEGRKRSDWKKWRESLLSYPAQIRPVTAQSNPRLSYFSPMRPYPVQSCWLALTSQPPDACPQNLLLLESCHGKDQRGRIVGPTYASEK